MKASPHSKNEVHSIKDHVDRGNITVTFKHSVDPVTSFRDTHQIKLAVEKAHKNPANLAPNERGNIIAQEFEEGWVAMLVEDAKNFSATEYFMDFYDLGIFPLCSRMHIHTGERMVTIKTGPDTQLVISSLSPIEKRDKEGKLVAAEDLVPGEENIKRYNLVVPPNSVVEVQIPAGVSHQFNAFGPHAVITSKHIEDVVEVKREDINDLDMMKQTIFLQDRNALAEICFAASGSKNKPSLETLLRKSILYRILLEQNAEGYLSPVQVSDLYAQSKKDISPLAANGTIQGFYDVKSEFVIRADVPEKVKKWCQGNELAERIIEDIEKSGPLFIKKEALDLIYVKRRFEQQSRPITNRMGYGV